MADLRLDFCSSLLQSRSYVTIDGQWASGSVCLGVKPFLGPKTRFSLLSESCEFVDVGRSLWRQDGSVVCSCCWPTPAQSFWVPSLAGLMTTFYSLRFKTPQSWRAWSPYLYSTGTGWPSYTLRHWVPFSLPPTTRRATVEIFEPASTQAVNTSDYDTTLYKLGRDVMGNTTSNNVLDCCGSSCLSLGKVILKCLSNCCRATDNVNMSQYFFFYMALQPFGHWLLFSVS
jgi:hypothetical protein